MVRRNPSAVKTGRYRGGDHFLLSLFPPLFVRVAVNALGRMSKWREAIGVLEDIVKDGDTGGDQPDAFVYASVINACGKAGRPVEVS